MGVCGGSDERMLPRCENIPATEICSSPTDWQRGVFWAWQAGGDAPRSNFAPCVRASGNVRTLRISPSAFDAQHPRGRGHLSSGDVTGRASKSLTHGCERARVLYARPLTSKEFLL